MNRMPSGVRRREKRGAEKRKRGAEKRKKGCGEEKKVYFGATVCRRGSRGGGGGSWVSGPLLPSFGGPLNFIKREKNFVRVNAKMPHFSTRYPDLPHPLFSRNPVSTPEPYWSPLHGLHLYVPYEREMMHTFVTKINILILDEVHHVQ